MGTGECARCGGAEAPELCWWCRSALCRSCWDSEGHCGHPEADAVNRETGKATTREARDEVIRRALASKKVC